MKVVSINIDSELLGRCTRGDQTAWTALVARYERLVYSVALTFCPHSEDASDVFQQVWMELYQQLSDLRHFEALPAWLITVTRRLSFKLMNSRRSSEPLDEEAPDLKEQIKHIEREHALERALDQLPDRCRTLIDLLYFDEREPSYSQVASIMNMPQASIGPTRARCLEKLRRILG